MEIPQISSAKRMYGIVLFFITLTSLSLPKQEHNAGSRKDGNHSSDDVYIGVSSTWNMFIDPFLDVINNLFDSGRWSFDFLSDSLPWPWLLRFWRAS